MGDIFFTFFPNVKKIINNSSSTIALDITNENYSWCDINDTTVPISSLSKGIAIVSPKILRYYTVSFDGNGATSGSMSSFTVNGNDALNLPQNAFTKEGYKFKEWAFKLGGEGYCLGDGGGLLFTEEELWKTGLKKITFKAKWELDTDYGIVQKKGTVLKDSTANYTVVSDNKKIRL